MPHLDESTASTLYDYDKFTSIKDNAHVKYEITKNVSNHKTPTMLTMLWLQYMCKDWYLIFMVLLICNWYLPQCNSSIHSSSIDIQIINTCLQQKDYIIERVLKTIFQSHFKDIQHFIPEPSKVLSNSNIIEGVCTRHTPSKGETLYTEASSLAYTGTKQIPQVSHIRLYQVITPSKNGHISSRTPTILTNLIMINTKGTTLTEWKLRVIVIHNPNLQQQVHHSIHKHFGAAETVNEFRVRLCNLSTMRTPSKEKGKASQMIAVDDIVFSTEMSALDFEPSRQEETFL